MRLTIPFLLLALSMPCFSTECLVAPDSLDPREHWPKATDVIYGQVLRGQYTEVNSRDRVSFDFDIFESLKGELNGVINIQSSMYSNFGLGQSYIIFLYGGTRIKPCAMIVELFPGMKTMEELYYQSKRIDINFAKDVRLILPLAGYKP
jgi:hypothetical protein